MSLDLGNRFIILDGGMGTMLQRRGLPAGAVPELLNFTEPEMIYSIHREYIEAGSQVIYTNTFGASAPKLKKTGKSVKETVAAAVSIAKRAVENTEVKVALDIGPLGELLEPMGMLPFEKAYEYFREIVTAGRDAGAELIVIETMTDLYETKAAVLAAKENSELPVLVTMSFEESGRTFTGCNVVSFARTIEGLGADAIGLNCSLGPDLLAPLLKTLCENTRLPVIAKPNAGLPDPVDGHYDMDAEVFSRAVLQCVENGVSIVGGCCGTTPEYIRSVRECLEGRAPVKRSYIKMSYVCTPVQSTEIRGVRVIGERINPTGKKRFQQALLEGDLDYILDVGMQQEDAGADILDVNVGYPGVDEVKMLPLVVKKLQSAISLPLQLDSSNPEALEAGLRVYNGKPAVNSVNGEPEVMERILPLIKKYGAAVVGLTLDKGGIPQTAEGRIDIARRILEKTEGYGIAKENLWIDCLTLTVSAQQSQGRETLRAVDYVRHELGLQTVLGVSNISFGLPQRTLITRSFLTQAMYAGLTLPIINPNQREMMDAVAAFRVLSGEDEECRDYVARFAGGNEDSRRAEKSSVEKSESLSLEDAIIRGMRAEAGKLSAEALKTESELEIVEKHLIPALDLVGDAYEKGKMFLPQLLSAAQAAQAVFEVIKTSMAEKGNAPIKRGRILVATVQGDVHDIGKNIVKTVLENYGYELLDLGKDVPVERVVEAVEAEKVPLVGLSALMTTTLPSMEKTIEALHRLPEPPTIFVGGAVVTPEYAKKMGADFYAKDAKESVEIARKVFAGADSL